MVCIRENSSPIPHVVENKGPSLIPRKKTRIFNKCVVLQTKFPVANAIHPVIQPHQTEQFYPICVEEQVLEPMKGVDISKVCGHDEVGNKIIILCSQGFHV